MKLVTIAAFSILVLGVNSSALADEDKGKKQFQLQCTKDGQCDYQSLVEPELDKNGKPSHPKSLQGPLTIIVHESPVDPNDPKVLACPYWLYINGRWVQIGPPCK